MRGERGWQAGVGGCVGGGRCVGGVCVAGAGKQAGWRTWTVTSLHPPPLTPCTLTPPHPPTRPGAQCSHHCGRGAEPLPGQRPALCPCCQHRARSWQHRCARRGGWATTHTPLTGQRVAATHGALHGHRKLQITPSPALTSRIQAHPSIAVIFELPNFFLFTSVGCTP